MLLATNLRASSSWCDKRIFFLFIFSLFLFIGALFTFNPSLRQLPRHFIDYRPAPHHYITTSASSDFTAGEPWIFDSAEDGQNYGLSDVQCSSTFPKLYTSIDEMVARHASKPIRPKDLDATMTGDHAVTLPVKAMIFEGELFIVDDRGMTDYYGTRLFATLDSLHRALISFPDRSQLPNCEFIISWGDKPARGAPVWGYTKKDTSEYYDTWLMPDFGFFSWPEPKTGAYTEIRRAMKKLETDTPFEAKIPKLVWRGAPLIEDRVKLLEHSQDKDWANVQGINWEDKEDLEKNHLTLAEHCRYMFIGHVSGLSWSGQGKYVRNCHSVIVSHTLEWREIYDSAIVYSGPEQNAVRVADDWSDLDATMKTLLANTTAAKSIADNAKHMLRDRYLTPAAEACYWRKLIQGYASVSFDPELYEADKQTLRGVPYESFTLLRKVRWDAY
ncbi:MAG: hypothetical protein ASARMPREDX12_006436 [Alectoria sarmentosa]|nr:MAG: hypothetical protein ASARMPREDX12_006436 [Alectoria sarmentosa]